MKNVILVLIVIGVLTINHNTMKLRSHQRQTDQKIQTLTKNIQTLTDNIQALGNETNILTLTVEKLPVVMKVTVTAYNADPNQTDSTPNITAFNTKVKAGGVAVSRDLLLNGWVAGRKVYIEGQGVFTINDLMHSRKTKQLDIFMHSRKSALRFGVKKEVNAVLLTDEGSK